MVSTLDRWTHGDEVYRTTDGGQTWKALFPKVVRDDAGAKYLYWHKPNDPIGRGWMGDIDIDPFNPGRVMYVTGQGIWAPRMRPPRIRTSRRTGRFSTAGLRKRWFRAWSVRQPDRPCSAWWAICADSGTTI